MSRQVVTHMRLTSSCRKPGPGRVSALLAIGVAGTLTFGLAGCGGGASDNFALPTAKAYFKTKCPNPGIKPKQKKLTYWSMWTKDEPQGKVLQYVIKCFQRKTGVKVDVQWLGRKLLTQNVAPALHTSNVPDIFDQDILQMSSAVVQAGGTQSVQDVLKMKTGEGNKTVGDAIPAAYRDFPQIKDPKTGKIFEIPYTLLANGWWYNKKKLKHFHAPKTINQLFGDFDKAKKSGTAAISQDGDIQDYDSYYFTRIAEDYAGPDSLIKASKDKSGKSWTSNPGFLKAAQFVQRIAKGHYLISGWNSSKFPQVQDRWADGHARFIYLGSWGPSETREYLNKEGTTNTIDYDSFQMPEPPGAKHDVIEQMPIGFAVAKQAKHAEAAKAFISYFINRKMLAGIPAVADNLTPRKDLPVPSDLKSIKKALEDPKKEHTLFMGGLNGEFGGSYVENVFFPNNYKLLQGKITAKQFVQRMQSKTAKFWKSRG